MAIRRRPGPRRSPKPLRSVIRRTLLGASAVAAVVLYAAAPAGAVNATLAGNSFGFEPRAAAAPLTTGHLTYHGGPVMHSNNTYAIYWDPPSPLAVSGTYDGDWQGIIDGFLRDVGQDSGSLKNVFAVTGQYTDAGGAHAAYNSSYRGAYADSHAYPANGCSVGATCLTDAQIRGELSSFIAANSLPTGMTSAFFVLTPPGVTVCTDAGGTDCSARSAATSFCSYHSFIGSQGSPGPATVLYAVQPWTAGSAGMDVPWDGSSPPLGTDCQDGGAVQHEPNQPATPGVDLDGDFDQGLPDLIVNQMSVELVDMVTNPLMNGWYDGANNSEQSDQCRDTFPNAGPTVSAAFGSTGADSFANQLINGTHYYLNGQFNLAAMKLDYPGIQCLPFVRLAAAFTAPTGVNAGDSVGFNAAESLIDLGPPAYSWNFGDGSPAVGGTSAFHTFTAGGTYTVTLTATDLGGNVTTAQRQIMVAGPAPAPTPTPTPTGTTPAGSSSSTTTTSGSAGGGSTGGGASSGGGSGAGATGNGGGKAPVATEQIVTHSLSGARRAGVSVKYRVNQAVAGRFQIMIDAATARRLHIKGAHVAGGTAGRSSSIVIGTAILVTLQGGGSNISVHFTRSAASHLTHTRSLPITVKLTVAADNGRRAVVDAATTLR